MKNSIRFPHLLRSRILGDLPDDFKTRFIDECAVRTYEANAPVLSQGNRVHAMYQVAHGSVEVSSVNAEGQTVLIRIYRQGDVFGDAETLSEMSAAANCTATTKSVILLAAKPLLLDFLRSPKFIRNIMRESYERLVHDNTIKFVDQFYPVEQRLCDYLYRLSIDRAEISKTQADLAGLLGCARQTLNRELGRLRDRDVIMMEKGKIRVIDRETLCRLAHDGAGPNADAAE